MNDYELEILTIAGIADSDYLDRLAVLVYDRPELIDPLLGLNEDGSISASFCVAGIDPLQAAQEAVKLFLAAVALVKPAGEPTKAKSGSGTGLVRSLETPATVERLSVARVGDREAVPA